MSKFHFTMDVEPKDIPDLDDAHKRDCVDIMNSIINRTFKHTAIISLAVIAFFGLYLLFDLVFCMRMGERLPLLPLALPFICGAIFIAEFVAGTMNRFAIVIVALLFGALIFVSLLSISCVWIIPVALYAIVINLRLFTLYPVHKALSAEPGYPEFTPLPTKEEVVKIKKTEE